MDSNKEMDIPVRHEGNPLIARRHRREFWGQILIPVILLFIFIFTAAYFLLSGNSANITNMAQIGSMFMLLPIILVTVFLIGLSMALIYLLAIIMKWIPPKANQVQNIFFRVNHRAKQVADLAAKPVIFIESWAKAVQKTLDRFF